MTVLIVRKDRRPVGMAALDRVGLVGFPKLFRAGVCIEIQSAVDNLPIIRIAGSEIVLAYGPCTIAAELRRVLSWVSLEGSEALR